MRVFFELFNNVRNCVKVILDFCKLQCISFGFNVNPNKAKQSFSNDREHGKLRTFLGTKAKQFLTTALRLTA